MKAQGLLTKHFGLVWFSDLTRASSGSPLLHKLHLDVLADHLRVSVVHKALESPAAAAPSMSAQRECAAGPQRGAQQVP